MSENTYEQAAAVAKADAALLMLGISLLVTAEQIEQMVAAGDEAGARLACANDLVRKLMLEYAEDVRIHVAALKSVSAAIRAAMRDENGKRLVALHMQQLFGPIDGEEG
jgi:hypothetical protein